MNDRTSPKALILLASRPDTVEIAVRWMRPKVLAVIFSQEVFQAVAGKCRELEGAGTEFRYRMVDHPMGIEDSFAKFELTLAELGELGYGRDEVLLDATGGTTPMRVGAALAATTRGLDMIHQQVSQLYVDGRWERDESKEVKVVPMQNPLVSKGLLREGQAVELFNRRDYAASALVFEDVVRRVSGVARRYYYQGLLHLARGYGAWDVAEYGQALEELREARERLNVGFADQELAERAELLVGRISTNLAFLGKVRGRLSVENVADMLENARRRIADQGRYDDGVARLYRTVEMYHQLRLEKEHGVSTSEVDWGRVQESARERFLKATGMRELPGTLDLTRARTLDRILSGEELEDDPVFRDLLQRRNHSILAHGLQPIGEEPARRFLEHVERLVGDEEVRAGAEHPRLVGL